MTSLKLATLASPLGPLALAVGQNGLVTLDLEGDSEGMVGRPMPYAMMRQSAMAEAASSVPVEPGQVGTSVMLSLQYEMVR